MIQTIKENSKLIFIINLIIISIPFLLITGPFLPDLATITISLFFIYYLFIKNEKFFFIKRKYVFVIFLFWLVLIFSSILSKDIYFSLRSSLPYIRFFLLAFAINFFLIIDKRNFIINILFKFLIVFFSLLIFDSYYQFLTGANLFGYEISNIDKLNSFFDDDAKLGGYIIKISPLLIAIFFYQKIKNNLLNFLFVIFLILLFSVVILSGSRSAVFLNILLLLFFFIFSSKKVKKYLLCIFFIFCIIFTFLFNVSDKFNYKIYISILDPVRTIFNISPIPNKLLLSSEIKNLNKSINEKKSFNVFTEIHETHYKTALKMFLDQPVLGHGPKMFRIVCKDEKYFINNFSCSTHPHNYYIQLLAETGLLGFFLIFTVFVVISLRILSLIFKRIKNKDICVSQVFILISFFLNFWPLIPTGNFFNNWLSIIVFYPIGFYYKLKKC